MYYSEKRRRKRFGRNGAAGNYRLDQGKDGMDEGGVHLKFIAHVVNVLVEEVTEAFPFRMRTIQEVRMIFNAFGATYTQIGLR